ncbi:MAG TPA: hypothetical protein VH351_10495 [Bryobacteraceae bacterium]|jgi:hypothetical protein|nr:hypothetical protein [Bryobacteraceae bacterium]
MTLAGKAALFVLLFPYSAAFAALSSDDMNMLQDAGGWEYLSIADVNNGFKTSHVCFDEQKGKGDCRGTIVFQKDGTFTQDISAEGKNLRRHGTYQITDDGIVFVDELETKDGPYTLAFDHTNSVLTLETVQAGVTIRTRLQLEKEFRKRQAGANKPKP